MSVSINPLLTHALRWDDAEQFRSTLEEETGRWQWPRDSPTSDYDLLMKAIRLGCKRIANLLLDKGAKVFKNGCKTTPLHQAVMLVGWGSVVERLLALGARVTVQNTRGDTVLHQAFRCRAPSYPAMEMLLKAYTKETSMDVKNRDGLGFLHIASTRDKTKYLQEYLDAYATDVDAQVSLSSGTHAGYTALHFAVAYGRYESAEILLKNGASLYCQDVNGSTPLHFALERRNSRMIDLLLSYDHANKDVANNMGLTHFMAACAGSDSDVVGQFINVAETTGRKCYLPLIKSRVKDNVSHPLSGYTALHVAAEFGQAHIVYDLITVGADPCALTTSKMTPYMLAVLQQHTNVCLFMQHTCEFACDETLFADTSVDVDAVNVAEKNLTDVNGNECLTDLLKRELDLDASNGIEIYDSDDLSIVARRCRVANPFISSTPSKLKMAYELMNI